MSRISYLPDSECARARGMLTRFLDDDLAAAEESAWFQAHLRVCAECRAAMTKFTEIDAELKGWGQRSSWQDAAPGARAELAARLGSLLARRRAIRWMPAAAAAVAAAMALAMIAPQKRAPAVNREPWAFVGIPYLAPLDPRENATIVRMNIRVATLIAVGYRVNADPDTVVYADVLVGEDGRAHAIRVLSDIDLNGTGD